MMSRTDVLWVVRRRAAVRAIGKLKLIKQNLSVKLLLFIVFKNGVS